MRESKEKTRELFITDLNRYFERRNIIPYKDIDNELKMFAMPLTKQKIENSHKEIMKLIDKAEYLIIKKSR